MIWPHIWKYFLILIQLCNFIETKEDFDILINADWKITNEGFHREIVYTFDISLNDTWNNCNLCIEQALPSSLFTNADQLDDLKRLGKVNAYVNGSVNVETPEMFSEPYSIYIYPYLDTTNSSAISMEVHLPIHLRYHAPQKGGGYHITHVKAPQIFISYNDVPSNSEKPHMLPCVSDFSELCSYHNLMYSFINNSTEIMIPVGNTEDYDMAYLVTYFVTAAGCVYVCAVILLHLPKL